ncbi:MAG: hypothetical protein HEEMFOPI_01599 [Holosporales bacterium]
MKNEKTMSIKSFIDIIEALYESEKNLLNNQNEKHPGIIGEMYEGLTADIVSRLSVKIFEQLELKVTKGIIVDCQGGRTGQIDCMLVSGEGKSIPYTDNYIYNINDVIAVFEVKKNINKTEMADALKHLGSICSLVPSRDYPSNLFNKAYTSIMGKHAPERKDVGDSLSHENIMYHFLSLEAVLPLRVIIGYNGYKTESGFRTSFLDILNDYVGKKGMSPLQLPSLVISDNYSIVKLSGMPFAPSTLFSKWMLLGSSKSSGIENLIELIWTRLNFYFDIPAEVFGEDLKLPIVAPLLSAFFVEEKKGWEYNAIELTDSQLKNVMNKAEPEWFPPEISVAESEFLRVVVSKERVHYKDKSLKMIANSHNTQISELFKSLNGKRLVYKADGQIRLLAQQLSIIIHPSGKIYAVDLGDTKVFSWIKKYGGAT